MLEKTEKVDSSVKTDNTAVKLLLEETAGLKLPQDANSNGEFGRHHHCPPGWIFVTSPYPHCEKRK